ncbi:hypothetical protein [Pseudomonas sp. C9]|uniref:hypothetical protein n=1 Tax=Pseudomonas sp. C9 TaxID=1311337 RepID=UPI00098672EB|nr:hypothetical protein [Pseudomonas sp. C9]OOG11289.1 hypothetical protein BMS17_04005 [Pseudomonas sp. C9]
MATLEERIYEGNRAKECLENEAFIWAFESIEQEYTNAWRTSPVRDEEGREKIYLTLLLLAKLKATITHSLETGKLADLELQHRKTLADRAKEILRF